MAKYRGKYPKSQSCVHAIRSWMYMAEVNKDCPCGINYTGSRMVDKATCEQCDSHKPKEE